MRTAYLDLLVQVDIAEAPSDPDALYRFALELLRAKAEEEVAREEGTRLVTDRKVEIHLRRGSHVLVGGDLLLIACRWPVEVPDRMELDVPARRG